MRIAICLICECFKDRTAIEEIFPVKFSLSNFRSLSFFRYRLIFTDRRKNVTNMPALSEFLKKAHGALNSFRGFIQSRFSKLL